MAGGSRNNNEGGGVVQKGGASKPSTYQGEPDPTVLGNWLREFEKLFRALGCPENSKVGCATYYLREETDLWWQQNEATIKALPGFNWTMFQEKVRDKFHPSFLQKQKAEEFSNPTMGDMSVTDYYTKFIELSRFAKESVATEKAKARKFQSGLTTDLQLKLCGQVFETLDEVYGRSVHLYALELKKKKELAEVEGKEKRKDIGQNSGNPQGGRNFSGGLKNSNQGNNKDGRRYFCKRCRNNHPGKDCEGNLVTCRACNKLGHREYECFFKESNRNKKDNNTTRKHLIYDGKNPSVQRLIPLEIAISDGIPSEHVVGDHFVGILAYTEGFSVGKGPTDGI
ncbi:uncharacterized protein LOC110715954 [Chenopodium quinoa]|uniref:uncharacterized protein LOC110715954 n=1 Tax=Chenopodium quinoa TaxID=63459 RepID=UPI000B77385F|nr:uncharacterized protein LOC110715954 [Chenopodium quinoa]